MSADLSTDPAVVAFPRDWSGKPQRTIRHTWPIGPADAGGTLELAMSCSDNADRKSYTATILAWHKRADGTAFTTPLDGRVIARQPRARYSRASFEQFAADALAKLRSDVLNGQHAQHLTGAYLPADD